MKSRVLRSAFPAVAYLVLPIPKVSRYAVRPALIRFWIALLRCMLAPSPVTFRNMRLG